MNKTDLMMRNIGKAIDHTSREQRGETASAEADQNGADLLGRVANFFERFVYLQPKEIYTLLGLWVIASHLHRQFDYMGYLFICSPEPQCGKSRLLELLDALVPNSSGILVSPTQAVLFRTAWESTQLLDEVDSWLNRDDLKSVLNAGFKNGGTVARMRDAKGTYEVEKFPVYCPRALAGIGESILDNTTRDRSFMIRMERQKPTERREPFRMKKLAAEVSALRTSIAGWANANQNQVAELYNNGLFVYLQVFNDRTIDIAQPLGAVAEVCFPVGDERQLVLDALRTAIQITRKEQQARNKDHMIVAELFKQTEQEDPLIGNATELAERCVKRGEEFTAVEISAALRRYGFKAKSTRVEGGEPRSRYTITRVALAEILDRYAPPEDKRASEELVVDVVTKKEEED